MRLASTKSLVDCVKIIKIKKNYLSRLEYIAKLPDQSASYSFVVTYE